MTDEQKSILDVARFELNYRREKQWKIFSWAATILVSIIGGALALAGNKKFEFSVAQRTGMIVAILAIAGYACLWVRANIRFEGQARERVIALLKELGETRQTLADPDTKPMFGYGAAILLVAAGAVFTMIMA
jgi:hypothetical protein